MLRMTKFKKREGGIKAEGAHGLDGDPSLLRRA